MTKIIIIIVAVVVFLVIVFSVWYLINKINPKISHKKLKDNPLDFTIEFHDENKDETPYLIKKNKDGTIYDGDFRVVCCADLHLATSQCVFGLTVLERLIDKTHPDLLVLLGDNVCERTDTEIEEKVIALMEKKHLYYAFVLGNHDSEKLVTAELKETKDVTREIYEAIRKKHRKFKFEALMKSKYCVGNLNNVDTVSGVGNYSVNIKNSTGVINTLYFFDSGDYVYGVKRTDIGTEKRCYDYLRSDQLQWYKDELDKNNHVKSIAFFHIPLSEYYDAYKFSLIPFCNFKKEFGNNYEKPCSTNLPCDAFKVFKEGKSTKVIVVGHDHKNDSCISYQGIRLMYSMGLQYDGAYNRRKKNPKLFRFLYKLGIKCYVEGVSVFDINKDKIDITPVYAEKEDVFYDLEQYYKKAWLEGTYKR